MTDITNLDTVKAKTTTAKAKTTTKAPAATAPAASAPATSTNDTGRDKMTAADKLCWQPYRGCATAVTAAPAAKTPKKDMPSYSPIAAGTVFDSATQPGKTQFNFQVQHAQTHHYFEFGIGPLCIFCAAVFSIFWGTLAGLLVRRTDMSDLRSIEKCIETYGKTEEEVAKIGGHKQANSTEVMATLEKVGTKITEGAKAFLYKEYIWLTIWSVSFAIVIGSTVDLLEMEMQRAPINFPYTATAYLTGSMTSILAGYIGMRIAVYTNTRVTFTCCTSVHKGFITAFRGGQVLGFVLVGLGVLNIMIIILLFKACWYNTYLDQAVAAGMPVNHCPLGNDAKGSNAAGQLAVSLKEVGGFTWAQEQIWIRFEQLQQASWVASFNNFYSNDAAGKTALGKGADDLDTYFRASSVYFQGTTPVLTMKVDDKVVPYTKDACLVAPKTATASQKAYIAHNVFDDSTHGCIHMVQKSICDLWTAATTTLKAGTGQTDQTGLANCQTWTWAKNDLGDWYAKGTDKNFGDMMTAYQTAGGVSTHDHEWSQTDNTNDLLKTQTLLRGEAFTDHFPGVPPLVGAAANLPRSAWIWSDLDQLSCVDAYDAEFYKFKQRICVLTRRLFECVAGYGLGGSSVALFGRVGGGIYTKAADVGADLVGKTIQDLKEDDITNPGTIADNVGDNVGDIAGMGSDLFGSLAESSCAALVVSATSYELVSTSNALFFPISITASGAIASWFSVLLVHVRTVTMENVQSVLKFQIGASTFIMTGCIIPALYLLPPVFTFEGGAEKIPLTMHRWVAFGCVMFGLWSGMIIGFITNYYTNNAYSPTKWLADACDKGPAPNIILGLALGYVSVVIPIICITATIGYGFAMAGMYGIGLSALGMLGSLPVALSVDGYGPISDNAGGCAEMSGLPAEIRDLTDALDAAGNTTAAVGKGFAIGSACLVGLALFGAFITRIGDTSVDILKPTQFAGLLIGAMLPYFFTAMTMKAVGDAAYDMMNFIIEDYNKGQETKRAGGVYEPNYEGCIKISTQASLKKMVAPGCLVIGTPILAGFIFGPNATAGVLAGNIVSGVQVAISQSNSGGAWDNAKKEVEIFRSRFRKEAEDKEVNLVDMKREYNVLLANRYSGVIGDNGMEVENTKEEGFDREKFDEMHENWMKRDLQLREQHIAAVVGDTVGDPLKDTSGPAINILVKLSAITSLVFGNYLAHYHIFGNAPAPIQTPAQLLAYCNKAGENPNTVAHVMKQCEGWIANGYFGWSTKLPLVSHMEAATKDQSTKDLPDGQKGIPFSIWKKWDKAVESKA